ncbi:class I SAM-dependent methyltransferase [Candidatus Enterococcus ikei]|uniref:Class I SAM-dependent methyltransferase n=1 Tax=Candidatus Enterococcus ikei TaxID=2815326 RepID=A0ABS3H1N7_9ENTE|nr:class I SAM-dependent methyltransferase [Enterococcus sp. DIV0869a]MBO0441451.1 class I SAM-dependent methyltransferase [Enterococcus sp. DIV0869a]
MADWNTLIYDKKNIEMAPEAEVVKFVELLAKEFPNEQEKKVWDLGCGAGRHSIAIGKMGCEVFISDHSVKAIELTKEKLDDNKIRYTDALSSMENYPWQEKEFLHGVLSWAVLQHNTLDKIVESINCIHESLIIGGYFLGTIKSTKADLYGKGKEIEKDTFILAVGKEEGVPHHYFDEEGIKQLFPDDQWEMVILAEQVVNYVSKVEEFWEFNPFRYTTWCVLAKKR